MIVLPPGRSVQGKVLDKGAWAERRQQPMGERGEDVEAQVADQRRKSLARYRSPNVHHTSCRSRVRANDR